MDNIKIKFRGKIIRIKVKKAKGLFKIIGLMLKRKDTDNLLFIFKKPTNISFHSFFVFFPFYIIWLNRKNEVLSLKKVYPFNPIVKCEKGRFYKVLEAPANKNNERILSIISKNRR